MLELCHNVLLRLRLLTAPARLFAHLYGLPFYGGLLRSWSDGLPVQSPARLLEVGCGPGGLSRHLAERGFRVTGCDISPAMISMAKTLHAAPVPAPGRLDFLPCLNGELPATEGGYDAVIAASVINAASNPQSLLRAMCQTATENGIVALFYPLPTMTKEAATRYCRQHKLAPAERAALKLWASKAPKMPSTRIHDMVGRINNETGAGKCLEIKETNETLLDGMAASCILRKQIPPCP